MNAEDVLVIIPNNKYGSLSVCGALDLASALIDAGEDDDLEEIVNNASIDQTFSVGWKAEQAERVVAAVMRSNGGGDYWDDEEPES